MKLGTTSFAFRYWLADTARAPSLPEVIKRAAACGLERLQICENARPASVPLSRWPELGRQALEQGVELRLGTKTTDPAAFAACHERAAALGNRYVRLVLESETGLPATRDQALAFLDAVVPLLEQTGTRLALENYFGIACRDLAAWCAPYPAERVGFCVDTANSLRKFERLEEVLGLLSARAACWHVKDWHMTGTDVGFTVSGAPLGQGDLPLAATLAHIQAQGPDPEVFLENWPPATGHRETDIATDHSFLVQSIAAWRAAAGTLPKAS